MPKTTFTVRRMGQRYLDYAIKVGLRDGGVAEITGSALLNEVIGVPTEEELLKDGRVKSSEDQGLT